MFKSPGLWYFVMAAQADYTVSKNENILFLKQFHSINDPAEYIAGSCYNNDSLINRNTWDTLKNKSPQNYLYVCVLF